MRARLQVILQVFLQVILQVFFASHLAGFLAGFLASFLAGLLAAFLAAFLADRPGGYRAADQTRMDTLSIKKLKPTLEAAYPRVAQLR